MTGPKHLALLGGAPLITQPLRPQLDLSPERVWEMTVKGPSGPVRSFEAAFLTAMNQQVQYAVAFNSGASAHLAAYEALGITEGDEVIVPALADPVTVTALCLVGAQPVVVDVDSRTWTLDPQLAEAAITSRTKALLLVHQGGHPGEMAEILKLTKKHHLKLIEDGSSAFGSRYRHQLVGTFGDVAVFSFSPSSLLSTSEAGMLITNRPEYFDQAVLVGHAGDRARTEIKSPEYQQFLATGYGLKLDMSPYHALSALDSLKMAPAKLKQQQVCFKYFSRVLSGLPELTVPFTSHQVERGAGSSYLPIYFPEELGGLSRDRYVAALQAEGVEVHSPDLVALSQLPFFSLKHDLLFQDRDDKKTYQLGDFPVAEYLATHALSLPIFSQWPAAQAVMDQYVSAFWKVHEYYQELL